MRACAVLLLKPLLLPEQPPFAAGERLEDSAAVERLHYAKDVQPLFERQGGWGWPKDAAKGMLQVAKLGMGYELAQGMRRMWLPVGEQVDDEIAVELAVARGNQRRPPFA